MDTYDVTIIGGGIVGAACAYDLASRGAAVKLVERGDFCSGTTAKSTRLIHGGLRYLEQGQLRLVFESLRERDTLLRIAPHLVRPLEFLLPVYKGDSRSMPYLDAGLRLYDLLDRGPLPHHRRLSADDVLRLEPGLREDRLKGGFSYYDAQTVPERLTMAYLERAQSHGAQLHNYCAATEIMRDGRISRVRTRDVLTGSEDMHRTRFVINAAGPWVDCVNALTGESLPHEIAGTKGTHVILPRWDGAPTRAIYTESRTTEDRRPFFIVPYNGRILLGTTDIPCAPDDDVPTADEVAYLLDEAQRLLPGMPTQIVHAYAGVRPLPNGKARRPGDIPRGHLLRRYKDAPGLITLVQGKLTIARRIAQETGDLIAGEIGLEDSRTASMPLYEECRPVRVPGVAAEQQRYLYGSFGAAAEKILELAQRQPQLAQRISPHHPDIMAQLPYCIAREFVRTPADFLLRRTSIGTGEGQGLDCVGTVVEMLGCRFGWSDARRLVEIDTYRREIKEKHTVR